MKIGLDCFRLSSVVPTGKEVLVRNLVEETVRRSRRNEYLLFGRRGVSLPVGANIRHRIGPNVDSYTMWNQVVLPVLMTRLKCDVMVYMESMVPLAAKGRSVVTVLDLSFLMLKEEFDRKTRFVYRATIQGTVRRAAAVVAISESTKRDLISLLNISAAKVHVIGLGFSSAFRDRTPISEVSASPLFQKWGIHSRYLLTIGSTHAYKNLGRLVEALKMLRHQSGFEDLQLVIVGAIVGDVSAILSSEEDHAVILTGYVADDDLFTLTSHASVFCFPSLYEGFGIPILEAMSVGIPVVGSNVSSIPEVIGDAGLLFDPLVPTDMADKIAQVLSDEDLRKRLIKAGQSRSREFTWEKAADKFVDVLQTIS